MAKIQICSTNYHALARGFLGGVAAAGAGSGEVSSSDSEVVITQMTSSGWFLGGVTTSNMFLVRFFLGGVVLALLTSLVILAYSLHTPQICSSAAQYALKTDVMNL